MDYRNNPQRPCVHFFTVGTYGSHLHGDERGSVMRSKGGIRLGYNPDLLQSMVSELISDPVSLNYFERAQLLDSIIELGFQERFVIDAVNVRTEHFHLLVFPLEPIDRPEIIRKVKIRLSETMRNAPGFRQFARLWERKYHVITTGAFPVWYRLFRYALCDQGSNYYFKFTDFAMRRNIRFESKADSTGRVMLEPTCSSLVDAFGGTRLIELRRKILTGKQGDEIEELEE